MKVSACLVTRGDVPMDPIISTIPKGWEIIIWDNSRLFDLKVSGRLMAVEVAKHDIIYFQDDDVIFRHHPELVQEFAKTPDVLVTNNAHGDNPGGYDDVGLVGCGALVRRDVVHTALFEWEDNRPEEIIGDPGFSYECDFVVGVLAPFRHVDLPWERLYEDHPTRPHLCREPWQDELKLKYTNLARAIRDGKAEAKEIMGL